MSHCTLPISLISGKFLGSRDRLVVAGNSPSCNVGIQYVMQDSETGENYFQNKCELLFNGTCTEMEICGVSRLAKSFVAVATTDSNGRGDSDIELIDVETDINDATMKRAHSLRSDTNSTFTSLSFYSDQELLAAATDSGNVVLWDLYTGKEVRRFTADSCGLNKLEFTRSGQLLTCGQSTSAQLHVWDVRTSLPANVPSMSSANGPSGGASGGVSVSAARALKHPQKPSKDSVGHPHHLHYTSISSHSIYNKIVCGTSRGSVAIWDLRSEAVTEFQLYSSQSRVTSVVAHPWKQDLLISASSCGSVKSTDLLNIDGLRDNSSISSETIVMEPAAMTSIDCDRDSGMLLAVSALGGLWRLQLEK